MRSEPGKGEPVAIFVLDDEFAADGVCKPGGRFHRSVMLCSVGEDYSESMWPVVVKVKRGVSRDFVADRLEDLTDAIRAGFLHEIPEDLPERRAELIGKIRVWKGAQSPDGTRQRVLAELSTAVSHAQELLHQLEEAVPEPESASESAESEPAERLGSAQEEVEGESAEEAAEAEEGPAAKRAARTQEKKDAEEG
ncbi:MAG: hypothetical protein ACYS1C_11725 [Planctomycetota bacterium]|jgi:hypothetical protein